MLKQREMIEELKEQQKERKRQQIVQRLTKLKEDRQRAKDRMRDFSYNKVDREPLYLK